MARKKKGGKKNKGRKATAPHTESSMWGLRRAWLAQLAAALRHVLARAGAAVACSAALKRNQVVPFEGSDFFSASSSAPRPAPSPETLPPLTGAENRARTSLPQTVTKDGSSTPPPVPGSQASGPASVPAFNSDSSPSTHAQNSGSQARGSASATATARRLEPKPATAYPPKGAKKKKKGTKNRGLNQKEDECFPDGYHLNSLFEEDECHFVVEDDALIYARFCSKRAIALLDKNEICHICYFLYGKVSSCKMGELEKHCLTLHPTKCGFLCENQGCLIRTSSKKEAGRHHFFCHEKLRGWWVECLRLHGEM